MSEIMQSKLSQILADLESIGQHEDGVVEMRRAGSAKYRLAGTRSGFMRLGTAILRAAHAPVAADSIDQPAPVGTVHDVFAPGSTAIETLERHETLPQGVSFSRVQKSSVKSFAIAFVATAVIGTFFSIGANVTVDKAITSYYDAKIAALSAEAVPQAQAFDDAAADATDAPVVNTVSAE